MVQIIDDRTPEMIETIFFKGIMYSSSGLDESPPTPKIIVTGIRRTSEKV